VLSVSAMVDRFRQRAANLWNDFQPCIDLHGGSSFQHSVADVVVGTILEPQGQKTEDILERVLAAQRDRFEESYPGVSCARYDKRLRLPSIAETT
jgi:hypothetical protein